MRANRFLQILKLDFNLLKTYVSAVNEQKSRRFPRWLYQLWKVCGSPCPQLARHLRYRTFGWIWNLKQNGEPAPLAISDLDIAVIIVCHNYGRYLKEATESVLMQTIQPREILIVDDASSDETPRIAASFANNGVKYLRGEWRNVAPARNAGAAATKSPLLVFLDADDVLSPGYLQACRKIMRDPRIGIAYGDMQEFGDAHAYLRMPQFDQALLQRKNFISSHAMMRRQAFDIVGGYRKLQNAHEDWDIYRRIVAFPWAAKKARTFVHYRIHGKNMLQHHMATEPLHADNAALLHAPVTIFTPFAGRREILPRFAEALRRLNVHPDMIRLHWFNTSPDPSFEQALKDEMRNMPFAGMTYTRAPLPATFGHTPETLIKNRVSNADDAQYFYEMAVVYAYNSMLRTCDTDFVLTLEDDVLLSPSSLKTMLQTFKGDTSAVVAHYPCHLQGYSMVWDVTGKGEHRHFPSRGSGVETVGGSGFGCSLFRTSELERQPIATSVRNNPPRWYDYIAFDALRRHGKILCNWDVQIEHVKTERHI